MAMSYVLNGEASHSFMFGTKDSYEEFHLVPCGRQYIENPPITTNYIDIPGSSGQLDLSTILTGCPIFGNREGSLEFYVLNDIKPFEVIASEIANYLHGRAMKVISSDDKMWYYYGRLSLNSSSLDNSHSKITIDYHLDPFKYRIWATDEQWLWDPFDFDTGVVNDWGKIRITDYGSVTFDWGPMTVIPTITVHSNDGQGMKLQLYRTYTDESGETVTKVYTKHTFSDGEHKSDWIQFREGTLTLHIYGNGTIKIGAREVSL